MSAVGEQNRRQGRSAGRQGRQAHAVDRGRRDGKPAHHRPPDHLARADIDTEWHDLLKRAVAAGYGEHSTSALVELLKKPG
ncbi:hypothetical protein BKA01_004994 [Pseudonocardia eucalypti]|uniref:hypothetical protein n=1 Tax=Pseudonocardia eucalypti TaxID=648755 RepID=UPI00160D74FA|nr:hypothetical protein [Pseudonocardia eucalypti]